MHSSQRLANSTLGDQDHATQKAFARLSMELKEALLLLHDNGVASKQAEDNTPIQGEPTLLQQCLELLKAQDDLTVEPIRTIHHFACTGGTLISKCIAAMPNVQLLSEIDPFSEIAPKQQSGAFVPTDMIGLLRQSSRGHDEESVAEIFRAEIKALYANCSKKGLRLVLREHAHSHYCVGDKVATHPCLRQLLPSELPSIGIVTVRHPIDSWMSLRNNNWVHFEPGNIEEYSQRYLRFLDDYIDYSIFRYEEFVASPVTIAKQFSEALEISFSDDFQAVFSVLKISGDSGRSGSAIAPRTRFEVPDDLKAEASNSQAYGELCERLKYNPEI